jgi:hypothetical protein
MSLHSDASLLSIDRLGPPDLIETFAYLDRDPVVNVYLVALTVRDALAQPRDEFWAVRREGEIVALLHLGGQSGAVLPVGVDPQALAKLARHALTRRAFLPRRFQIIGQRPAVLELTRQLADHGVQPRLLRDQRYMALERGGLAKFERLPELRPARPDDFELVFGSGALLRAEELDEDPRVADPLAYSKRVEDECRDGYTRLWCDDQGLCFRASVSARTPDAAQISGVYVPPARRGRGIARRGMAEMCAQLLEDSRTACLFVNDFNAPAIAVYRRLGFTDRAAWASAFFDTTR